MVWGGELWALGWRRVGPEGMTFGEGEREEGFQGPVGRAYQSDGRLTVSLHRQETDVIHVLPGEL